MKYKYYTFDIEVYPNLFIVVFFDIKEKKYFIFEISEFKNERKELISFMNNNKIIYTGYNNEKYDNQILFYIYKNKNITNKNIKEISDNIINSQWGLYHQEKIKKESPIKNYIDLQKLWNYGIYGKSVSLKQLEYFFKKNIDDLPYKINAKIKSKSAIDKIILYCKKDVEITTFFLYKSKNLISYRMAASKYFKLNLMTDGEVNMVKKIFTKMIADKLNISEKQVKQLRTYREKIILKNHIKPVEFKIQKFKDFYNYYFNLILKPTITSKYTGKKLIKTLKSISYTLEINQKNFLFKAKYGLGGAHGVVAPGVYEETDDYYLYDIDFSSYYPHLTYFFNINHKHLPEGLIGKQLIQWFIERKEKYPKSTHYVMNYILKILMNLAWGQSGSEFSPLFDQLVQIMVCVNGMIQINKISEIALLNKAKLLYMNTDGILIKIHKNNKDVVLNKLKDYSNKIKIPLEFVKVKKFVVRDVNNLLLLDNNDKLKEKGCFETWETMLKQERYDKKPSFNIIAIALKNYFIHNISPEETVYKHNDILDFCTGVKGGSSFLLVEQNTNENEKETKRFIEIKTKSITNINHIYNNQIDNIYQFKLVSSIVNKKNIISNKVYDVRYLRYYISKKGSTLTKVWGNNSKKSFSFDSLEAEDTVTILQKFRLTRIHDLDKNNNIKFKIGKINNRFPDLNYNFYLNKIYDIIKKINLKT